MRQPVTKVDVLVVGGGAAGLAAAVGAARQGRAVALIERHGLLGGMATAACVGTVCGLYLRQPDALPAYAMRGFPMEFGLALQKSGSSSPVSLQDGLHCLPYRPIDFARLADSLLARCQVQTWFHTTLCGVSMDGDRVNRVDAITWDRPLALAPQTVVDCTGEATVSALAGLPVCNAPAHQAAAIVFQVEGLVPADSRQFSLALLRDLMRGIQSGELPESDLGLSIIPGSHLDRQALFKLSLPGQATPGLSRLTALEKQARQAVARVWTHLQAHSPLFKHARLSWIAPQVGVREGRRPVGRTCLSEEAVVNATKPTDGVAVGAWPIEQWTTAPAPYMRYFREGDCYTVPVDALRSAAAENLYFAGRNIAADGVAIASARVIGTCLGTGYAAGVLAARCASEPLLVKSLRQEMKIP